MCIYYAGNVRHDDYVANDIDVYDIYGDMVVYDHSNYYTDRPYHCVYCGRRDGKNYYYNDDALVAMYGNHIRACLIINQTDLLE